MSLPSTEALSTGYFFSACTAALTKKLMKPILTPCSLVKASWNFLRISITGAMFTSLNVVRMALDDCDCSRRSATRARRRLMGTRCSGRSPRSGLATGAVTWGSTLVGTPVGITAAVDCTPPATAASTSPLVTRPSLPVPATAPTDRLLAASPRHALGQHASRRRGHFEHNLVGFDLDQDLIDGDGLTGLLLPGEHGGLGHGLGQLGDFDFYDSHFDFFPERCFVLSEGVSGLTWSGQNP